MTYQQMNLFGEQEEQKLQSFRGGFPCQPHSVAGLRKASCDERDMWPEMRRVIGEIRPKWVVAENVRGLLSSEDGRFFRGILRDFADLGFDVGWCVISAASIGAIHRRERVAIIAHDSGKRRERKWSEEILRKPILQRSKMLGDVENIGERSAVFKSKLCRSYDGIPGGVDRIKCLGNSVIPQQFYPVFNAIAEAEKYDTEIHDT